jgi:pimeloyl-ACP methyl ester carboxylesterase
MRPSLPLTFESRTVSSLDGAETFVRSGGSGPVVVLLHGYAETSDSWAPLATELVKNYTIVVPDLRGIGRSSRPAGGYDQKTQAADVRAAAHLRTAPQPAHNVGNPKALSPAYHNLTSSIFRWMCCK